MTATDPATGPTARPRHRAPAPIPTRGPGTPASRSRAASRSVVAGSDPHWIARCPAPAARRSTTRIAATAGDAAPPPAGPSSTSPTTAPSRAARAPAAPALAAGRRSASPTTSSSPPAASTASTARRSTSRLRRARLRPPARVPASASRRPCTRRMRSANDQGYECLLLTDASAPLDPDTTRPPRCPMVTMSGGIFGALGHDADRAVRHRPPPRTSATMPDPEPSATDPDRRPEPRRIARCTSTPSPTPGPTTGRIDPARTALINIDWQTDFCGSGGYVDKMGYDLNLTRAGLGPTGQGARRGPGRRAARAPHPGGPRARPERLPAQQAVALEADRAPASATPVPCGRMPGAGRAGLGHRARGRTRSRASRSSTSRARARSTPPIST